MKKAAQKCYCINFPWYKLPFLKWCWWGGKKEAIFICKYQCKVPDEWPDLVVKLCLTKCKIMSVFVFPVFFYQTHNNAGYKKEFITVDVGKCSMSFVPQGSLRCLSSWACVYASEVLCSYRCSVVLLSLLLCIIFYVLCRLNPALKFLFKPPDCVYQCSRRWNLINSYHTINTIVHRFQARCFQKRVWEIVCIVMLSIKPAMGEVKSNQAVHKYHFWCNPCSANVI